MNIKKLQTDVTRVCSVLQCGENCDHGEHRHSPPLRRNDDLFALFLLPMFKSITSIPRKFLAISAANLVLGSAALLDTQRPAMEVSKFLNSSTISRPNPISCGCIFAAAPAVRHGARLRAHRPQQRLLCRSSHNAGREEEPVGEGGAEKHGQALQRTVTSTVSISLLSEKGMQISVR